MNDNSPFFRDNLYTTRVPENTDPGTVIITVTAEDRDEGLLTKSSCSWNSYFLKQENVSLL